MDTIIRGLSSAEAERRLKEEGKNRLQEGKKVSPFRIFLCQFKDLLTFILLVSTVVTIFMGEYSEAMTIGVIVLLNSLMGFIQEYKTEKTLEALKKMASPLAKVRRDGTVMEILGEDLVRGDYLFLEAGDRVPADVSILSAVSLSADESMLTGESTPVEKRSAPFSEDNSLHKPNILYAGTIVTAGRGEGVVIATGMKSQMGSLAQMIGEIEEEPTPLQKRLDELGRYIAFGCCGVCLLVALLGVLRGEKLMDMLMMGVSLAVAAVPEGLPAIVTISLALAVGRMVKRKSLIRKLYAVETLGCADTICSDKTGTLTENKMTVRGIWLAGERIKVSGNGYEREGRFTLDGKQVTPRRTESGKRFFETCLYCNNTRIKNGSVIGDPTEAALLICAEKGGETVDKRAVREHENPFDSDRKQMSVAITKGDGSFLYVKGSAEVLLKNATGILLSDTPVPMTGKIKEEIEKAVAEFSAEGLRVLGLAYRPIHGKDYAERNLIFLGLAAMLDPPRREAKNAVSLCRKAGIKTIMITGDHPLTACAVGKALTIYRNGDRCLTGDDLDHMSEEELQKKVDETTVFARVSPRHKLSIVRALKKNNHIVAMTGDGVNDAPAVKEADIGVSMGITGTDVTKEAAAVILLDDCFTTLVAAVEEGRTIYQNIRKFIRYLLSCNIGEVLTMFLGILMGFPTVLLPIHILLVNLITDGLPAIALGLEPSDKNMMRIPPRRKTDGIFSGGLATTILFRGALIGLTTIFTFSFFLARYDLEIARTAALLTLAGSQLIHVFECKSETLPLYRIPFFNNLKLIGAVLLSLTILLMTVYYPPLSAVFMTIPLPLSSLAEIGGILLVAPVLSTLLRPLLQNKGNEKKRK